MRNLRLATLPVLIAQALVSAQDTNCPRYPESVRTEFLERLELDNLAAKHRAAIRLSPQARVTRSAVARRGFIDNLLFDRMDADQVAPAPLTNDAEFLRRISIDLTGRLPQPEKVREFLADQTPNKRDKLIDALIADPAYTDQWTLFFANKFQVTSGYYTYIGLQGRTLFHKFLRDFVERDRPYNQVVTEMLTASGDADQNGPANFLVRAFQDGDPMQDTWDTATDRVTTRLLGMKTECISCHDGRGHLEQINLYMTDRRRRDFWGMSAFFSRMSFQRLNVDGFGQRSRFFVIDRATGNYNADVNPSSPGPRPARYGGPYSPRWMFDGQVAQSGNYRQEFARILTSDRQFAKATVNYVWAQLFTYGLVDPADGWDLMRIRPETTPKDWPAQLIHGELLDRLADSFIESNYSIRSLVRTIVSSNAYQLSSRYEGQWRPQYTRYFAKHFPRRLAAEELWDAVTISTATEAPMDVFGFDQPLRYANQLPDATEPRSNPYVLNFMNLFGRGDWWNIGRSSQPSLLQLLYTMNDSQMVLRTFAARADSPPTRVARIAASDKPDEEAIRELFLASLSRYPTADEIRTVMTKKSGPRTDWLSDLQWALLNKLDFIFNY